ncbi:MAG: glycosyltransferase [Lachnospiraceae bacterium]
MIKYATSEKKMKIFFYISNIGGGGAARVMTILANRFIKDENEVIFAVNFKAPNEYYLDSKVKRLFIEERESQENVIKKNLHRIITLRNMIKEACPNVVISFMQENDARAYIATRGLAVKLILSVRNDPKRKFIRFPIKQIAKYIYTHCDGVVFQTGEAKEWFHNIKGVAGIIYNPVDERFFRTERASITKNIVTTGKFLEQKNHMLLIKAFQLIADEVPDNLIIYGDGKLRKNYEEYIQESGLENRVYLPGYVVNVEEILASAKLFVMSSDYEGMPNSLMEAIAVGVPCISTDCPCGGPKELLCDELSDNLVPCNNDREFSAKMLKLLKNNNSALSVMEKQRAEEYRVENIYKQWQSLIEEIIC